MIVITIQQGEACISVFGLIPKAASGKDGTNQAHFIDSYSLLLSAALCFPRWVSIEWMRSKQMRGVASFPFWDNLNLTSHNEFFIQYLYLSHSIYSSPCNKLNIFLEQIQSNQIHLAFPSISHDGVDSGGSGQHRIERKSKLFYDQSL